MKKRILILITLLLMVTGMLCGCKSTKLASCYDKQTIKKTAEEVINEVQVKGAKEVLSQRMRKDFVDNIDLDAMDSTVKNLISGLGNYLTYSQETVIGREYDKTGEDFAVILVTVTYEKGEVNYTITFDKDMNIIGFYAK